MDANYDAVLVALTEHGAPANEVEVCRLIFERYLGDDGVIRGHRLTDQEYRDAMFPETPIWTDIGLLDPIETDPAPMDPELEEQMLRATEAIYDRLGIRDYPDILSRDELKRIVEESEKRWMRNRHLKT